MRNNVIIIGAGHAGAMTAISLRQQKYLGSILLIGQEEHLPYQRPPLSKGFLTDSIEEKRLYLKSTAYYENNDIEIIKNKTVSQISRNKKTIILDDQKEYPYQKLVIATGSVLNQLDLSCNEVNLHYLRTIEDSLQIKSMLNQKQTIAIIGAGYIGLEIAAAATKKNLKTTVIEMENRVMSRSVCSETSDFFQKKHEQEGVMFKCNVSVVDVQDYNDQKQIVCKNGTVIDADGVVVGIGIKPNIELAVNSGLECDDGIIVDENGQTSDENIFAVGDCTNHPNNIFQQRLRLETVHNAVEQAKSVAASITENNKSYHQVPWFWSDQYNIKLQIAGISQDHDHRTIRGSVEQEKFAVFYQKDNQLVAVEAINSPKEFMIGKKLIEMGNETTFELIEEMNFDLKKIIRSI